MLGPRGRCDSDSSIACPCQDAPMGLDVYVGPVTRYVAGDWLTIVQQIAQERGAFVAVVRIGEPHERVTDPVVIDQAVRAWRSGLLEGLGVTQSWNEDPTQDYR